MCKIVREGGDTGHGISLGYGYIPRGHISSSVCPRIENGLFRIFNFGNSSCCSSEKLKESEETMDRKKLLIIISSNLKSYRVN